MTESNLCRLCVNICNDYRPLYDESGKQNDVYDVTIKYFHPMFLNVEPGSELPVICSECWSHIFSFNNFQQSVLLTQNKLLEDEKHIEDNSQIECPSAGNMCAFVHRSEESTDGKACEISASMENLAESTAIKDEEDSISLPDLELMDVYRDIGNDSEELLPSSTFIKANSSDNIIITKTENRNISTPEQEFNCCNTEISSDTISVSSYIDDLQDDDDDDDEKFDDPVGFFIGGDLENIDDKTKTSFLTEHETIDIHSSSDESDVTSERDVKTIEFGIGSENVENNASKATESISAATERVGEDLTEQNAKESLPEDLSSDNKNHNINDVDSIIDGGNQTIMKSRKKAKKRKSSRKVSTDIIAEWRPILHCLICNEPCSSFELLQEHFSQGHPNENCYIECCQCKLNSRSEVENHIHLHNSSTHSQAKAKRRKTKELDEIIKQWRPSLDCPECSTSCSNFTLMRKHFVQHHAPLKCYILCCNQKLRDRSVIEDHIHYHMNPNFFQCRLCEKQHISRLQLYSHVVYRHRIAKDRIAPEYEANTASSYNNEPDSNHNNQTDNVENVENKLMSCKNKRRKKSLKDLDEAIARWKPNLECALCQESCSSFSLLQHHFIQAHPDEELYVLCCERKLKRRHQIEEHIRYHENPDIFRCKLCKKNHYNGVQLYSHMYYHHPHLKRDASQSDANLASMDTTNGKPPSSRKRAHKVEKRRSKSFTGNENGKEEQWVSNLECVVCHELYSDFALLKEHFCQKHPNEEYQILSCRVKLTRRHTVEEPTALNTTSTSLKGRTKCNELDAFIAHYEPNLKCVNCGELCSSFTLLREHFLQKHPREEFYVSCCKRKMKLRYAVAEHISFHINPQAFKCALCGKCYVSSNKLNAHMQLEHPNYKEDHPHAQDNDNDTNGQTLRNTTVLRKSFVELDDFITQYRPVLNCPLCEKKCYSFLQLEEHFIEDHHTEECHVLCCDSALKTRHQLEEHLLFHLDPNAFKCELCDKCFKTRVEFYNHQRSHRNDDLEKKSEDCRLASSKRRLHAKFKNKKTRLLNKKLDKLIAQWKPILKCSVCNESCSSFSLLENHFRQRHPDEDLYVLCCQSRWKHRGRLVAHIRVHHNAGISKVKQKARSTKVELDNLIAKYERELECVECGQACSNFSTLKKHFRSEHPGKQCYISCCGRKFMGRSLIVEHIRFHADPNAFKCKLCGHICTSMAGLRSHMIYRHINNNSEISSYADQKTNQSSKRAATITRRSPEQIDAVIAEWRSVLECVICNLSCPNFTHLYEHFRQEHPKEECHILCCERKLRNRQQTEEHVRWHNNPKLFECPICKREHMSRQNLNSHIRYKHNMEKDKDSDFITSNGMSGDKRSSRKSFKDFDDLIAQWKPTLQCVVCHESYASFSLLKKHFRCKHPNEKCHVSCCGRKFFYRYQLEEHISLHNDPNAFVCDLCSKCHTSKFNLHKHILAYHPGQLNSNGNMTI